MSKKKTRIKNADQKKFVPWVDVIDGHGYGNTDTSSSGVSEGESLQPMQLDARRTVHGESLPSEPECPNNEGKIVVEVCLFCGRALFNGERPPCSNLLVLRGPCEPRNSRSLLP